MVDNRPLTIALVAGETSGDHLSLALQGGGSYGAFTWGVLDRLLEVPDLRFDAISGASAGSVNAALLASGLVEGGREGARRKLEKFWRRMDEYNPDWKRVRKQLREKI